MNFEEAYNKVKAGTASEEEKAFVDKEIKEISSIKNILDNPPIEPVVARADVENVKKAVQLFQKKAVIRVIVTVLITLSLIAVLVCAIIFIPALSSANAEQRIDKDQAIIMAEEFLKSKGIETRELEIHDVDKELRIFGSLKNSLFAYEIEFRDEHNIYGVSVGTSSGHVYLVFHKTID